MRCRRVVGRHCSGVAAEQPEGMWDATVAIQAESVFCVVERHRRIGQLHVRGRPAARHVNHPVWINDRTQSVVVLARGVEVAL